MTHWRTPNSELPTPAMILWRRCVIALAGTLIGGGLAMLVWGFS
jgi:hypothetical protein